MKKLITLLLILVCTCSFAQMRGGAQYDPSAARKNLSNVDASATPSMTSITLSGKVRAAWADILGDIYASGTVKVGAGTAAAPAYTFSSDPDTGIYLYGTNDLAIVAGGNVGLRTSAGVIGVGTNPSTTSQLEVRGVNRERTQRIVNTSSSMESSATQHRFGLLVDTTVQPVAAGVTNSGYVVGARYDAYIDSAAFEGTLGRQYGLWARAGILSGTGTITNCYALYLTNFNNTGTITNNWALYQETADARNYFGGRTLFGTTTDDGVSAVQVAGGGLRLVGAAAPATPAEGTMYFNSTDKHFYGWNGTDWKQLDN